MTISENLVVHLGQAGCQSGLACWELFCLEHGIYPDGTLATEFGHTRKVSETGVFFNETARCKYVPRAIFFDFDVDVINDIRTGSYRQLYNLDMLVSGKEDAANNFARGFFTMGREFIDCIMDKFRHEVESVDHLTGLMVLRSVCGGTGSGFGSLLLQKVYQDHPKVPKVSIEVNPSPRLSTAAVEPYNCVLACHASMDYSDVDVIYENECCYSMFIRHLENSKQIWFPTPGFTFHWFLMGLYSLTRGSIMIGTL
ncbi:unnamed protein product [Allacma fusca]|uniref:Tubulin/FtsZ GTPase domain-containing protein n=1 Tax=Allacma fusca TaxID=39272 RepID=A0A8J2P9H4_9HEXA|nr:unnamed protein product [Allacma fusca]